jgi:multicomponent Na+:H+ antiporter subunit E
MSLFLLNFMLAVLWMLMWGLFDIYSLIGGFILGYLLLGIVSRTLTDEGAGYGVKGWKLFSFAVYFIRILVKSNLIVAKEIITPGFQMTPRFIRYPLHGLTDTQITTLANAITLTPGTLSADVSEDKRYLYVHCMYAQDRQAAVKDIDELRDRILDEVFG